MQVQLKAMTPVLAELLETCMAHVRTKRQAEGYLALIHHVCKLVNNAPNSFVPLIESLVSSNTLSALLALLLDILYGPNCSAALSKTLVELCLMLPARLSDQLTFLPKLMRPLLLAIQSKDYDLMGHAFKTLEVWVDSLNPQFLEPNMQVRFTLFFPFPFPPVASACS